METAELLNKLRGWANDPPALFLDEFAQLYAQYLRKDIPKCKCPDKVRDAVLELYVFIKRNFNNMDEIKNTKAILRPGCVIYHVKGYDGIFTNANLTDEIARAFLEQRPDKKMWFEVLPDAEEATEETTVEEAPAEEATEEAPAPTAKKRGRKSKK